jgi:hypothetical protein
MRIWRLQGRLLSAIAPPHPYKERAMSIKRSSRTLAATFVVASLTASPALASPGPIDNRTPDAKDAAAKAVAVTKIDRRSPDAKDAAQSTGGTAADLRVTSSLAGPPSAVPVPLPGPPQFPTSTVVLHRPAEPVTVPFAGDGVDVGDAGIGAGGAIVLALSIAGGIAVTRRRRVAAV